MDHNSFIQSISTINCDLIPGEEITSGDGAFQLVKSVCNFVLTNGPGEKSKELLEVLENFLIYPDVKYLVLKSLLFLFKIAKKQPEDQLGDDFVSIGLDLLTLVRLNIPNKKRKADGSLKRPVSYTEEDVLFSNPDSSGPLFSPSQLSYETQADIFASVWFTYLSFKLKLPIYRKVLKMMDEKIMPHFRNPLSLSDFLISSFNVGGSSSLLALSSLYILITKCNLDYPDFYKKFYSLVTPDMIHVKYRARFFYWTDIFLSSAYIPAYMAAAFAKKLARLTLTAPVDAILIILPIIKNLIIRHPSLNVLINKFSSNSIEEDPFDITQEDPAHANAMESSLWEISSLSSHWHVKVAGLAGFIRRPLPSIEVDLADILETNYDELEEEAFNALDKNDYDIHFDPEMGQSMKKFFQT